MTNKIIRTLQDLADLLETTPDEESLSHRVYKGTDCGAWLKVIDGGVEIGSIVEGSDAETTTYKLCYPFSEKLFWDDLQRVEDEASMLWDEANGEDDVED